MGVSGKQFGGRSHFRPGARGRFSAPDPAPGAGEELFTQLIIGTAKNGAYCLDANLPEEERVIEVSSLESARKILREGELLEAVMLARNPSNDEGFTTGPQKFILLNINQTTKAYRDFATTSSDAANTHRISHPIPGPWGKKVRFRKNNLNAIEIGDSEGTITSATLSNPLLTIHYLGDGSASELQISGTALTTTVTAPTDGSQPLNLPLADYPTIQELADQINISSGYVAEVIGNPEYPTNLLDAVEAGDAVDIKAAPVQIKADLEAEIAFIEDSGFGDVTVGTVRRPFATSSVMQFLDEAGGTSTAPVADARRLASDFAKKLPAMYRNLLGGSLADKLYFRSNGAWHNSVDGNSETFCGVGRDALLSDSEAREEARTLGSYWTNYGFSNFWYFGMDGKEKLFPGYMLSVIDNAISASGMPRHSPTWKGLATVLRPEKTYLPEERDAIIRDGGLVIAQNPVSKAWIIERSITTERKPNIILNEKASVTAALYMVKTLREGFNSRFIGKMPVDERAEVPGVTVPDVLTYVERTLEQFVLDGFLIGSEQLAQEAFNSNFSIRIDGDTWSFTDLEGNVVLPINFIFYLLTLRPLQGRGING